MEQGIKLEPKFFTGDELDKLYDIANQQLKEVNYYHWVNKTKPDDIVTMLDHVEFIFIDNTSICFSASELCDAIELYDFDFDATNKDLFDTFEGDLYVRKTPKSEEQIWQQLMQLDISEVLLEANEKNKFFSDKITLKFGREKMVIQVTPTGLVVKLG
ncbi:MAG: hypothetical protein IPP29_10900 [Bacteroidetes bacterium]|nr:hypothetical protein [Bacteroidota bacterium]